MPLAEAGGKGHRLAWLATLAAGGGAGFEVPRFVVIPARVFDAQVVAGRPWPASLEEATARRDEVLTFPLSDTLRSELLAALAAAGLIGPRLAVRSSGVSEDSAAASFAGQFDSILGVRATGDGAALWEALRRVWASAFHAHAAAYRVSRGQDAAVRMAVVAQALVEPEVSGVAFSADPVSGDSGTVVVSAVYGLGEGLVSGELDADTFRVCFPHGGPATVTTTVALKDRAFRVGADDTTRAEPVPETLQRAPALDTGEAVRIATAARAIAAAAGAPQDIEWALMAGPGARRLVMLQTRAITTLGRGATGEPRDARVDPVPGATVLNAVTPSAAVPPASASSAGRGERRVWDNSNIIESYSGVTTPLTFSFAREVYENVYLQFCRLLGVSEDVIARNREVFPHMLGLLRGRVYYNLLNWYRLIAMLPGFTWNRAFMERMMGVRERLTDAIAPTSGGSRGRDLGRLVWMLWRIGAASRRLRRDVPAFRAHVDAVLTPLGHEDLATWPADRVIALYHRLERELLDHWRPPLVNDFFAMIHFGVLGRLVERWLPDEPPTLVNDLLCGEGGVISTEPARLLMAMAREVAATPALARTFADVPDDGVLWGRLASDPACSAFHRGLVGYLERFGDRCMEELKLETVTLSEDPRFVLHTLRAYVAQGAPDPEASRTRERAIRVAAETRVRDRLGGLRGVAFRWVLAQTRARIRDRENLRFERTRVFGIVRRMFVALGAHLAHAGALESPRDVFYLTRTELFGWFDGTLASRDLRALVRLRRAEFDGYRAEPPLPDRIETFGPPGETVPAPAPPATGVVVGATLTGLGCCPGVVRAPVCVVRDPRAAHDLSGRILVAERTDPGWTLLFPAASGLLVQRGSLLSHSAIVAREMGLPCVVGIAGLLDTLRDGEEIEMNGATGVVRRLEVP